VPLTDRIVDISEHGADLSVKYSQLVITMGDIKTTVPITDISVLVISHPAVRISHAVLSDICSAGGICVFCTVKQMPAGMLLPVKGNSVQSERFVKQALTPLPTRKRIWKQIVKAKIMSQRSLLLRLKSDDKGLGFIVGRVKAGDPSNLEAMASKKYWDALFGHSFRRNPDAPDQNKLLNYGYAVLRAVTARAICSSGLHPSIGLHHHSKYNAFCLADDLMEPFRAIVDDAVYCTVMDKGPTAPLDKESKKTIINNMINKQFKTKDGSRHLFDIMTKMTASLAKIYTGERSSFYLPEF